MRDYKNIYQIIEKLKEREALTDDDCDDLVNILEPGLGEFIPTIEEYLDYQANEELVNIYNKSIKTADLVPALLNKMDLYNEKYHKGE